MIRDIIGYLVGYAHLSNTRSLALFGDPDASAYELLFSFSTPEENAGLPTDRGRTANHERVLRGFHLGGQLSDIDRAMGALLCPCLHRIEQ